MWLLGSVAAETRLKGDFSMSIPRKLSTALLTVLATAVAIVVPLFSTTSALEPILKNLSVPTPIPLYRTCVEKGEFLLAREECDAFAAANYSFDHAVLRPVERQDLHCGRLCTTSCDEGEPYLCLGVGPR
jgi:hypothetical protein